MRPGLLAIRVLYFPFMGSPFFVRAEFDAPTGRPDPTMRRSPSTERTPGPSGRCAPAPNEPKPFLLLLFDNTTSADFARLAGCAPPRTDADPGPSTCRGEELSPRRQGRKRCPGPSISLAPW